MRLLVQTFEGQVRTWFRGLPTNSIETYDDLETSLLRQWGAKKTIYIIYLNLELQGRKHLKLFLNLSNDSINCIERS
jgi:hypothetical protein